MDKQKLARELVKLAKGLSESRRNITALSSTGKNISRLFDNYVSYGDVDDLRKKQEAELKEAINRQKIADKMEEKIKRVFIENGIKPSKLMEFPDDGLEQLDEDVLSDLYKDLKRTRP